jgi:plasmid maintenance system antidote protein VapI
MNANALKGEIVARGLNVEKLAKKIGINRASMYRKLNNFEKFTIGEAQKIKKVLGLSDERANEIFFGDTVA